MNTQPLLFESKLAKSAQALSDKAVHNLSEKGTLRVWMFGKCYEIPFVDEYPRLIIRSRIFEINKSAAIGIFLWPNGGLVEFNKGFCDVFNVTGNRSIFYNGTPSNSVHYLEKFMSEVPTELTTIFEIGIMVQQIRDELIDARSGKCNSSLKVVLENKAERETLCCRTS